MGKRIIILGDVHDPQVSIVRSYFSNEWEVVELPIGASEVADIKKNHPCLIVIFQSGAAELIYQFLKELHIGCRDLPILYLVESPTPEEMLAIIHAGVDDLLPMPCTKVDFYTCLERIYQRHHLKIKQHAGLAFAQNPLIKIAQLLHLPGYRTSSTNSPSAEISLSQTSTEPMTTDEEATQKLQAAPPTIKYQEMQHRLDVHFLGEFQVSLDRVQMNEWPGKKARQLFAYIAYKHRPIVRDVLMELLWPGFPPESSRNCLHVTLHQLRSTFTKIQELDVILFKDECYLIDPRLNLHSDVDNFRKLWKRGCEAESHQQIADAIREYEAASQLYHGDFLSDFPYENWCDLERENLKETYLMILNKLSHYYSLDGKPDAAIEMCHLILSEDPCREDTHRRLMRCFIRTGQKDKALKQYEKCCSIIKREFDAEPCRATKNLYEKIKKCE